MNAVAEEDNVEVIVVNAWDQSPARLLDRYVETRSLLASRQLNDAKAAEMTEKASYLAGVIEARMSGLTPRFQPNDAVMLRETVTSKQPARGEIVRLALQKKDRPVIASRYHDVVVAPGTLLTVIAVHYRDGEFLLKIQAGGHPSGLFPEINFDLAEKPEPITNNCNKAKNLLACLPEKTLPEKENHWLRGHVTVCNECRVIWDEATKNLVSR